MGKFVRLGKKGIRSGHPPFLPFPSSPRFPLVNDLFNNKIRPLFDFFKDLSYIKSGYTQNKNNNPGKQPDRKYERGITAYIDFTQHPQQKIDKGNNQRHYGNRETQFNGKPHGLVGIGKDDI
jgi:hypothetical protein